MTHWLTVRFYDQLNDFLPAEQRNIAFSLKIKNHGSIKDLIEATGVPHTEVDVILVNGKSVDFNYKVQVGDQVSVYPYSEAPGITSVTHLHPEPPHPARFVLDTHLGRLAAYLRMLGFDSSYRNDYDDITLAEISVADERILLTCDRQLLMRKVVIHGYYLRARQPQQQMIEVLKCYDLFDSLYPFTRCMHCNGILQKVDKSLVEKHLQPRTRSYYDNFWQCPDCNKVYWKGSHYKRMQKLIETLGAGRKEK
jgi:uncharacterized protein with PIN domain